MAASRSPSDASSPSNSVASSNAQTTSRSKQKIDIPPGMTLDIIVQELRTATDPKRIINLKKWKRLTMNRKAAYKSRRVRAERMATLERDCAAQHMTITTLQQRDTQWQTLLTQAQQEINYWKHKASIHEFHNQQSQQHQGYGTINPQYVNVDNDMGSGHQGSLSASGQADDQMDYVSALNHFS